MGEFLTVVGLALLPALGNFGGGVLAEWLPPSRTVLNYALHLATGIILAVLAVEVMPRALGTVPAWLIASVFLAGGATYLLVDAGLKRWQEEKEAGAGAGTWMVYAAVVADLIGDGLLIGAGSAISARVALVVALGQVLADIPEGYAVVANFRDEGVGRGRRLLLSASFAVPVLAAAMVAFLALRGRGDGLKLAVLVFVAGLYLLAAVEDILREAHESATDSRWSALSLLAGFSLFVLISARL